MSFGTFAISVIGLLAYTVVSVVLGPTLAFFATAVGLGVACLLIEGGDDD